MTKLTLSTDFQYFEEKAEGSHVGLPGTAVVLFRSIFNFAYRKTIVDVYLCCLLLGLNFGVSWSDSTFQTWICSFICASC